MSIRRRASSARRSSRPSTGRAKPAATDLPAERLQKVLARAGLGSRREIEHWISDGRVTIDGRVATLGERVTPDQKITVDHKPVGRHRRAPTARVLMYHKPEGEVSTRSDPQGRPTVFDRLPRLRDGRWVCIGRLDVNSSGLLLFTTDGELANRLMHPSGEIEREYAVRVLGEVTAETLQRLRDGVDLDDGPAHFEDIAEAGGEGANRWYHVLLKEGRNREVRRMWEAVGVKVSRLIRVRFGSVEMPRRLRTGRVEDLDAETMASLYQSVGLAAPVSPRPAPMRKHKRR